MRAAPGFPGRGLLPIARSKESSIGAGAQAARDSPCDDNETDGANGYGGERLPQPSQQRRDHDKREGCGEHSTRDGASCSGSRWRRWLADYADRLLGQVEAAQRSQHVRVGCNVPDGRIRQVVERRLKPLAGGPLKRSDCRTSVPRCDCRRDKVGTSIARREQRPFRVAGS